MNQTWTDFAGLTPELIHKSLQDGFGLEPYGLINHLPSYINRVYEVEDSDLNRYVIKYYRPGRWTENAIMDEHDLLFECQDAEIPVAAPLLTKDGSSLCRIENFFFALFPKKSGRLFETNCDDDYIRLGCLAARLHNVSERLEAPDRIRFSTDNWKSLFLNHLVDHKLITVNEEKYFTGIINQILESAAPLLKDFSTIPCHGDCHRGNILDRGSEGLMLIDLDDMCHAPEVQDLWMLLPGHAEESKKEWMLMLEGYSEFRNIDPKQFILIEPLRAMRMLYYLSWSARQLNDPRFRHSHPDWGTPAFWSKEIGDFRVQLQVIREVMERYL